MASQKALIRSLFVSLYLVAVVLLLFALLPALEFVLIIELNSAQRVSIAVFSTLIIGTLLFWKFRLAFALGGLAILLGTGVLDIPTLIEFAGLDIILFLVGMMIVIGYLEEEHFFEFLLDKILRRVGGESIKLVIFIMIMAAVFAALVDEVTSILFMAATVLHLAGRYKVNPIPFIIMTVFATNIGSSATVVGNPVGVMIALRSGFGFVDFIRWATPISVLTLFVTIAISLVYFSKPIRELGHKMNDPRAIEPKEDPETVDVKRMILPLTVFLLTIGGLVLHKQVEYVLHLKPNTMLLGTSLLMASLTLFINRRHARELVERRVDWWTLSFFLILFASVGTLEFVGITRIIADGIVSFTGRDEILTLLTFMGVGGILSAIMDNVLAVATLMPIVQSLEGFGLYTFHLWWGLLMAGTLFGNLTMIGSTANIVAIGMVERQKAGHITFSTWIKPGLAVSIPTLILAALLILLQMPLMPR